MSKEIIVRIMGQIIVDGVAYEPNQLVKNLTGIDGLQKRGMVSTSAADIKYCQEILGKQIVGHTVIKSTDDDPDAPADKPASEPANNSADDESSKPDAPADSEDGADDKPEAPAEQPVQKAKGKKK